MSPHAPPHLKFIAPVLMAGEDVVWMNKPDKVLLAYLESVVLVGCTIVFWILISLFGGLPVHLSIGISIVAAIAAVAILHVTIGMRTYVITDRRLLVTTAFNHDVHDSCELSDITEVSNPRFTRSLLIARGHGRPIRLWAVKDMAAVVSILTGRPSSELPDNQSEPGV